MLLCGSRVLQLFCHKVETAKATLSIAENNWNGHFSDLIDLQGKKQVWQILSNFTQVRGFIPYNPI